MSKWGGRIKDGEEREMGGEDEGEERKEATDPTSSNRVVGFPYL